jgi:anti-sigma factor RsiW
VSEQLSCVELVELVTDYFDDALTAEQRRGFEGHLAICRRCTQHVGQMRLTVKAVGTLRQESLPPPTREELLELFREWKRGKST